MARLDGEDSPIDLLGQVQSPGPVVLDGDRKCF